MHIYASPTVKLKILRIFHLMLQGFAKYILSTTPDVMQKGVIIGYDARHNSTRLGLLSYTVLTISEHLVILWF